MVYLLIIVMAVAGLFLLLMEIFIPSYGLLTVGGLGSLIASLYLSFQESPVLGLVVLGVLVVLLPIEIILGVKFFPHTWVGKRIVLTARGKTAKAERSSDENIFALEGKEGITKTACRPAGVAEIEGRRVDVVAEGMMIEANRPVKVLHIDGNRVVVRET